MKSRLSLKPKNLAKKPRIGWTCCDACRKWHSSLTLAWLHWRWLRLRGRA